MGPANVGGEVGGGVRKEPMLMGGGAHVKVVWRNLRKVVVRTVQKAKVEGEHLTPILEVGGAWSGEESAESRCRRT